MTRRIVTFGGSAISVACEGAEAESIVEFVFRGFASNGGLEPHVAFEVSGADSQKTLVLLCQGLRLYKGESPGALGRILAERAAFHLSDRSSGGLLLHAAAVQDGHDCVLLPGRTGSGKSTLAAWLSTSGYEYLTDELAYIPTGTKSVIPFPRPLNIRTSGMAALEAAGTGIRSQLEIMDSPSHVLCRPLARNGPGVADIPDVSLILFPRFDPDAALAAEPLSKAETALRLMGSLINARNLTEHGQDEAARLARAARGFHVSYSDFRQIKTLIHSLAAGER